jgi:putative Holliday junction resolvase
MRIIGIDYGDKKIGVAVSDPLGMIARGVETIRWNTDINKPLKRIVISYGAPGKKV